MPRSAMKGRITTLRGKAILTFQVANGNSSVINSLSPAAFARLTNVQKAFEFYRFTKVSLLVPPWGRWETTTPNNSSAVGAALGFYPEETTATTTTITPTSVLALDASIPLSGSVVNANTGSSTLQPCLWIGGDSCARRLTIPKRILLETTTKWFRTNGTTSSEVAEIVQGQLIFAVQDTAGANTVFLNTHVSYEVEFCGNTDSTALTLDPSWDEVRDADDEKRAPSVSSARETLTSAKSSKVTGPPRH